MSDTSPHSVWAYHDSFEDTGEQIVGYDVDALDGDIGKVSEETRDAGSAHLVVDTGFWIFGKQRLIPAGVVSAIDHQQRRIAVNMTKEQVKSAPDWDVELTPDEWRADHNRYYTSFTWWPGGEPAARS